MNNFFDFIEKLPSVKRLRVNDLLMVEYHCPVDEPRIDIWSHHNYFIYVANGKKKWFTINQEIEVRKGDCLFVRKGAHSVIPYSKSDPCILILFIPDEFIRSVIRQYRLEPDSPGTPPGQDLLFPVDADQKLHAYFHSMFACLSAPAPEEKLLELKFRELILMIVSGSYNAKLSACFAALCKSKKPSLRDVIESNYNYPMNLEEFARLSSRSLSSFKRDFKQLYGISPGRWLTRKRISLARYLLEQTGKSLSEVVHDSGFKSNAHFHRIFKQQFGITPTECRDQKQKHKERHKASSE